MEQEASQASEVTRRAAVEAGDAEKMEKHHISRAVQREHARIELAVKAKAQVCSVTDRLARRVLTRFIAAEINTCSAALVA